jgi:hypothetical protein
MGIMSRNEFADGLTGSLLAEEIAAIVANYRNGEFVLYTMDGTIAMPPRANIPDYRYELTERITPEDTFSIHCVVSQGSEDATNKVLGDQLDAIRELTGESMHLVAHNKGVGLMLVFPGL